jgi:RNA polymerase sigma-70 factor (ECF subfamily)
MTHRDRQDRFLHLLKPYHDRLARFARAMTNSREEAEDLTSDTILQAYEHFEELRDEQAFLSWLFAIASRIQKRRRLRGRIFDRLTVRFGSARWSDDGSESESGVEPEPLSRDELAPDTFVDVQYLYEALERLPAKQREALVLFEISGLSLAEIQEIQGDSLSAIKMRLARARERLRELLGEETQKRYAPQPATTEIKIHHLPNQMGSQTGGQMRTRFSEQ